MEQIKLYKISVIKETIYYLKNVLGCDYQQPIKNFTKNQLVEIAYNMFLSKKLTNEIESVFNLVNFFIKYDFEFIENQSAKTVIEYMVRFFIYEINDDQINIFYEDLSDGHSYNINIFPVKNFYPHVFNTFLTNKNCEKTFYMHLKTLNDIFDPINDDEDTINDDEYDIYKMG